MEKINKEKFRTLLIKEREEILQQNAEDNGLPLHMNPDRDDLAQDYITLEKNIAIRALEREQLDRIENALKRLEEGSYGLCANCGDSIPEERLEIIPYAVFCVHCQTQKRLRW